MFRFAAFGAGHDVSEFAAAGVAFATHLGPQGRRSTWRVSHRVPCRIHVTDPHTGHFESLTGETVNLSRDGVAIQVAHELPPGARVEVVMPGGNGEPVCLFGRVVHTQRILSGTFVIGVQMDPATVRQ